MRIISLNANGIRAAARKGFFDWMARQQADVVCIQETKAQSDQVREALFGLPDYHLFANSAQKKGYSGTAILSKLQPDDVTLGIGIPEHDTEGRVLTLTFPDFHLMSG